MKVDNAVIFLDSFGSGFWLLVQDEWPQLFPPVAPRLSSLEGPSLLRWLQLLPECGVSVRPVVLQYSSRHPPLQGRLLSLCPPT